MQHLWLVPLNFLNDCLILAKASGCFFHLWVQIKFPLKSIPSKGQHHELLWEFLAMLLLLSLSENWWPVLPSSGFQLKMWIATIWKPYVFNLLQETSILSATYFIIMLWNAINHFLNVRMGPLRIGYVYLLCAMLFPYRIHNVHIQNSFVP